VARRRDLRSAAALDREPEFRLAEAAADCPAERQAWAREAWGPGAQRQVFPKRKSFRHAAFAADELRKRIIAQPVPKKARCPEPG